MTIHSRRLIKSYFGRNDKQSRHEPDVAHRRIRRRLLGLIRDGVMRDGVMRDGVMRGAHHT